MKDGVIVGKGAGHESYLMFKDELGDFQLRFSYRLLTKGNTGVEVRGKPVKGKASRLHGYHADLGHVGIGDKVLGAWDFHENNRGDYLAKRGERVTIGEDGVTEEDILIHDETNRALAGMLALLEPPSMPVAIGVL